MKEKTYTEKAKELDKKIRDWLWGEYLDSFISKEEFANNSLSFALVNGFQEVISVYCYSYADDEDGWIDIDKWAKFFETHTLNDCAEVFLMFNHPKKFDPFGFSGYGPQLECLETIINEIIKEENR